MRIMHTLGALTLLACGLPLSAQSWDTLRELKPGDAISLLDTAGHERKGAFTAFSSDAIGLQTGGGEVSIERPRVRRVQAPSPHTGRSTARADSYVTGLLYSRT